MCNLFLPPYRLFAEKTLQEVYRDSGALPYPKFSVKNYMSAKAEHCVYPMQSQRPDGALVLQSGSPAILWCAGAGSW